MERNKIKISCNPYSKEIEYKRWGYDKTEGEYEWIDLGSKSSLVNEKYTKGTIQHNAYEIVGEIDRQYNPGNIGLDIVFEGTVDDYNDLRNIIEYYYNSCDIQCKLGERYILVAREVMPQIQEIFSDMTTVFKDYSNDEIKAELNRFHEASKITVPICVMGLYSSGKSAFINALIGNEILPSASDPTTAKNYRISSSEKIGKIKFQYNGEDIELVFDEEKYRPNKDAENDLIDELQSILKEDDSEHSPQNNMYRALQIINDYDKESEKDCISDLIEIEVPFNSRVLHTKDFDFVIYDTPGSNSASNAKHLEVLKQSLEGQTNGLPVFITTPDSMDSKGNDEIINIIEKMGDALDKTNTMIVVNKSDEKDSDELIKKKNKCEELRITKWKSTRIYFVSSILGIGSKKNNAQEKTCWINKTYFKVFKQQYKSFSNREDDFYLQLYKYNIMPKNRYDEICVDIENVTLREELVYANSGLMCVEKEIIAFANRYALYNKCLKAQDYLNDAIELTSKIIIDREEKIQQLCHTISQKQKIKEKSVISDLETKAKRLSDRFTSKYPKEMSDYISKRLNTYYKENKNYINSLWEKYKHTDKDTRINNVISEANKHFKEASYIYIKHIISFSENYWELKHYNFKDACCGIVMESKSLTDEEKDYVKQYVMSMPLINVDSATITIDSHDVTKYIEIFGLKLYNRKTIDVSKLSNEYNEQMKKYITRINQRVVSSHQWGFKNWKDELKNGLLEKVTWLNPELRDYAIDLGQYQNEIKKTKEQQDVIVTNQKKIDNLLNYMYKEICENE